MSYPSRRLPVVVYLFCLFLGMGVLSPGLIEPSFAQNVDFLRDVQPILAKHCFACHGPDEAEGGIAFSDIGTALVEGESGEIAIVPGDPESSHLLVRLMSEDEFVRMPPEGERLDEASVEVLRRWIQDGAEYRGHWAFEPLSNPAVPSPLDGQPKDDIHPIDAFVHNRLTSAKITQNPTADRRTLIRRVYYDLVGLPPTAKAVQAFVTSQDPAAYENMIDELLNSHHYGEKWGRHWLDLVRYAETNSFERDGAKPNVWKFRDYVIKSFNDDKPYDQFIREQLAGDLLDKVTRDSLIATGYYRLGIWDDEPADPLQARFDELDDLVTTTSQAFLGLTINCARCHDHKIDPIPTTDYYGMIAFFADVTSYGSRRDKMSNNQLDVSTEEIREKHKNLNDRIKRLTDERYQLEQSAIARMDGPDQRATEGKKNERKRVLKQKLETHQTPKERESYQELAKQLNNAQKQLKSLPPRELVLGLAEKRPIEETFVLYRGNPHSPADPVTPRFPEVFETKRSPTASADPEKLRRRELADWIATKDNRLTSRVIANRIWQHHFGRGIVRSSNNFGMLGTPPTHPELLDFLANRFIDFGWRFKEMHRFIMTSKTYQMASTIHGSSSSVDPGNDLFWRFDPRRLSAEEVRDSILQISDSLNPKPYGPSVFIELSQEVLAGQSRPGEGWGKSTQAERNRRTVYIHVKRSLLPPLMTAFDFPEPDTTCEARFATLQPGQAMSLLNSDFVHEQARLLAEDVHRESSIQGDESYVAAVIERVFSRPASPEEIASGSKLIKKLQTDHDVERVLAQSLYALSTLNWNEFLFIF